MHSKVHTTALAVSLALAAVMAGCGKGPGDGTSPPAASASPSPQVWTVAPGEALLPIAQAAADGYTAKPAKASDAVFLCLTYNAHVTGWTPSTERYWFREGTTNTQLDIQVFVRRPDGRTAAGVLEEAKTGCPDKVSTSDGTNGVNQTQEHTVGAWQGLHNVGAGLVELRLTYAESTYLLARGDVILMVRCLQFPASTTAPKEISAKYLDLLVKSVDAAGV
ncbi:hypothetical protein [Catellatospora citrea]|uniref:PknH-like protein n=1 Tax=Catellatospora citrea TaxID=53366 RepID=A0A8J3KIN9_9ACTN|nr:hypothetical protein [Catellatospora citrea]RKE11169.1 hypothetical protein C8E86_6093 [Catellatospora citrea]GIF96634.1 hypothetical protein Cci01nite_17280 [Catellatospora citrea]